MTSQVVEGTWIRMGGYGRLRGECVLKQDATERTLRRRGCGTD